MQTFLPYPSFLLSAQCLDNRRLGKQRVEAYQILQTLLGKSEGWKHHPAIRMWRSYSGSLACYGWTICEEWKSRGFVDNLQRKFANDLSDDLPLWFGVEKFHISHQSNLVRKDPGHYRKFFPTIPDNLPYIWPPKPILLREVTKSFSKVS